MNRTRHVMKLTLSGLASLALTGCFSSDPASVPNTGGGGNTSIEAALGLTQPTSVLSSTPAPFCAETGVPSNDVRLQMLTALNAYRAANGKAPLSYSKRLETAADAHAADLSNRAFFDHINPDGEDPGQRALDVGFCHKYVGENIAAGQVSVAAVMTAWQNSPSHNENMLLDDYKYVGMGHFVGPSGRQYWTQEFAYELP